jgi:4-hydroxymandelate oxidase
MDRQIPPDTVSLQDYERRFHERVDPAIRAYIAGAAADGITQYENRAAFDRIRLMPRALVDMSAASARCTLLGETLDYPILLAPTAFHRLVHPDGELATAQAAALTRTCMTVSTQASVMLEDIARASAAPLWFQLYCQPRQQDTFDLLQRAEQAGYKAIVVTIDAVVSGVRNIEQRAGFCLPAGVGAVNLDAYPPNRPTTATHGSPLFRGMLQHAPTWADIETLCRRTSLPVLVKGLLNPRDVDPALRAGVAGIIVSNHGGRTLDTLPATAAVLPRIRAAMGPQFPILVDGGIRRGTDVFKAIALGADAVLIGRPYVFGLANAGAMGVSHVLRLLRDELEIAMALCGCATLADINADALFS